LLIAFILLGAVIGATLAPWQGYRLYGPNGIPAGLLLGSLGGAVAGLLSVVLLVLFILAGIAAVGMLLLGTCGCMGINDRRKAQPARVL
jgi:predicted lipid-binding transport protein (Tim44 family)